MTAGPRRHRCSLPMALLAAAAAALGLSSCHDASAALPPSPPIVTVVMTEFRFSYPTPVPSGEVIFRVVNKGHLTHEPQLFPLGGDSRSIQPQAPFAGTAPVPPGSAGAFEVDLQAGQRFGFVSFAHTPSGQTDASLGMTSEFLPAAR